MLRLSNMHKKQKSVPLVHVSYFNYIFASCFFTFNQLLSPRHRQQRSKDDNALVWMAITLVWIIGEAQKGGFSNRFMVWTFTLLKVVLFRLHRSDQYPASLSHIALLPSMLIVIISSSTFIWPVWLLKERKRKWTLKIHIGMDRRVLETHAAPQLGIWMH